MKIRYYKSHLIRWLFSIIGLKPKGTKQLLKELKFTIGEQYENYEFELENRGSKTVNGLTYEIYLYTKGTSQILFGLPVKSIYLYFNGDILSCVEYEFKGNQVVYLKRKINKYLPKSEMAKNNFLRKEYQVQLLDLIINLEFVIDNITKLYLSQKGILLGIQFFEKR